MDLNKFLEVNPEICHGKLVFKGTRIMVYLVLELIEGGVEVKEILKDYYPQLSANHIKAAIHYAVELTRTGEFIPFAHA